MVNEALVIGDDVIMKMPDLFIGHGFANEHIADMILSRSLVNWEKDLPKPGVFWLVSAHWLTEGNVCNLRGKTAKPSTTLRRYSRRELYRIQIPAPVLRGRSGLRKRLKARRLRAVRMGTGPRILGNSKTYVSQSGHPG